MRRPLYVRQREPLPIVQEAGWAPGPVWMGAGSLAPKRDSIPVPFGRGLKFYPFRAWWLLYLITDVTLKTLFARTLYISLLVMFTMYVKCLVVRNSLFGLSNGQTRFSVMNDQTLYI